MKYFGPEKETLDELAVRTKNEVNQAFRDITRNGVVIHLKKKQRKNKRKMQIMGPFTQSYTHFVIFGGWEVPLRQQLEFARRLQAAEMRTSREDEPYETICSVEQTETPTAELVQILNAVM